MSTAGGALGPFAGDSGSGTPGPPGPPGPPGSEQIIWRPGVPSVAGVSVATWAEVESWVASQLPFLSTAAGPLTVFVDFTFATASIPSTAYLNSNGLVTLAAYCTPVLVSVDDGGRLNDLRGIRDLALVGAPTATPFLQFVGAFARPVLLEIFNGFVALQPGATVSAIQVAANNCGLLSQVGALVNNSGDPTLPVCFIANAVTFAAGFLECVAVPYTTTAFGGVVGSTLQISGDASAPTVAQPLMLGTLVQRLIDAAVAVTYDDSLSTPPLGVSQVQAAIDALKASPPVKLVFGATLAAPGFMVANGNAASAPAVTDAQKSFPAPFKSTLTQFGWYSDSGDNTTELTLYKQGVVELVFNLDGLNGADFLPSPLTVNNPGDYLWLEHTGGTAPGGIIVTVA